jgi:SAM-dependent methyltransferase
MTLNDQQLDQARRHRLIFWHRVRGRAVLDVIAPDAPLTVADIGAGSGSLGWILREHRPAATYRFFEPEPALAAELRLEFGNQQELPDIASVATADVVAVLDVLEHIEDDRQFLAELVSSMKPGATLVVTVPALQGLWSEWHVRLGHHRRYNRARLGALPSGLPLQVHENVYLFPELIAPGVVRRFRKGRDSAPASEFPELGDTLDGLLERVGVTSYRARRWVPLGTSLLLRATRTS